MKKVLKNVFAIVLSFIIVLNVTDVFAAQQDGNQNLEVIVDNSLVVVPDVPVIIRSEDIATNALNLVVEVGPDYGNETIFFFLRIVDTITGDVTYTSYTQNTDMDSRATLEVTGLDPGTEYEFIVRYKRIGGAYSDYSAPHNATTLIDAPVLDSINNITTDSADLDVIIEPSFIGSTMDFVIEVHNDDTGDTYTVEITKYVTSIHELLEITGLDADTGYTFKVKYARENTLNFSTYSNAKSITTDSDGEVLEPPVIDDIRNVTTTSMELVVEVGGLSGEDLDFVVHVTNKATGEIFAINFDEVVRGDDTVVLGIGGLDPGTEYEFEVKYARNGESEYSNYSNPKSDHTEYIDIDEEEKGTDEEVAICYEGETIMVVQSELQDFLDDNGSLGKCEDIDTLSGETVDVDVDDDILEDAISERQKDVYHSVAAAGAAAGTVAALASSAIPFFAAMPGAFGSTLFLYFLELFGILGRRKEDRNWGIVFDSETHMPIATAKIVLLNQIGKEMATTYSDKDGRFGFLVDPGTYTINIFKKNYTLDTDDIKDELYGNLYDGKEMSVDKKHVMLSNIAMKAKDMDWQGYANRKSTQYNSKKAMFVKYSLTVIYFVGFALTGVITFFYPSIINFILLGLYIIIFAYDKFFKRRKYGIVKTREGKPIPFAVVSLYDKTTGRKKNFAVTDSIGRYYLLVDNGLYDMKIKGQPTSGIQFEKDDSVRVTDGIVRQEIIV